MERNEKTPTNSPTPTRPVLSEERWSEIEPASVQVFGHNFDFLKHALQCPGCGSTMVPPILFCQTGHSYCTQCSTWMAVCMICFKPMTWTRNINLERISSWSDYSCPMMSKGCPIRLPITNIREHTRICPFLDMKCPLYKHMDVACFWRGTRRDFRIHVKTHLHTVFPPGHFLYNDSVSSSGYQTVYMFLLHGEEILVYTKCLYQGTWFIMVRQVGMTSRKYECTYETKGRNGIDRIKMRLPVADITAAVNYDSKMEICFRLPDIMLRNLSVNRRTLVVSVYINDITKSGTP